MAGFQLPDFGMIGAGIGDLGAAAGDLMTQSADYQAAHQFTEAGNIESENVSIARASGAIQEAQAKRALYRVESGQGAAAGGAGLSSGGSMTDVLRSTMMEGGLQQAVIGANSQIQQNNFAEQAQAYYAESDQATASGNAAGHAASTSTTAGITSFIGAGLSMLSFL